MEKNNNYVNHLNTAVGISLANTSHMYIPAKVKMITSNVLKRKPLGCITNVVSPSIKEIQKCSRIDATMMMPHLTSTEPIAVFVQNKHPILAMYKDDAISDDMSFSQLNDLLNMENEEKLLSFLTEIGIIAKQHICEFCGGNMRKAKQGNIWYWICYRRVNGIKCNRGKFGVRKGTFLDHTHLTIQNVTRIIWNFVYGLDIDQCKHFCCISNKTDHTVVEYYADCRNICNTWIWDDKHTPKLGGFGKVVEMDESFFPGAPKYNRGRRLGTNWDENDKWVFGLTQRDSLDCVLIQVPPNRSRETLIPIIERFCLNGTIFDSDCWKAYFKLDEHINLEDCQYFSVNHSKNYVDPETGAHTQTIEGLWSHVKNFLPIRGMKPHDLSSYLGHFMWDRFCKQRKLDKFVHFLRCAAEIRPPSHKDEYKMPDATCMLK